MKKKCKVIMLPTEKTDGCIMELTNRMGVSSLGNRHLYLISDDEPKMDDYVYDPTENKVYQITFNRKDLGLKKVIASTDAELTFDTSIQDRKDVLYNNSLPQIPESFIKTYVEANGIDEVNVEYAWFNELGERCLPESNTEKHLKLRLTNNNEVIISEFNTTYSREEVERLCRSALYVYKPHNGIMMEEDVDKWIEENL